ncbi:MAG: galactose-1-phosphate uridylyltransferase [Candidatus Helarchaeota archaeon]
MGELRWNPILQEWVIVASHRTQRPVLPKTSECPFCPGSPEIAPYGNKWKSLHLPNKFPALMLNPPSPNIDSDSFFQVKPALGICEVLLYTPSHTTELHQLSLDHIEDIIDMWSSRFQELGNKQEIKYVFIFENRGHAIGVSLDHPHGQLYAFPFIPKKIKTELNSASQYMQKKKSCLFCDVLQKEREIGSRIVYENSSFTAFIPFFATWPYGVHIYSNTHHPSLLNFTGAEKRDFASILKIIRAKYDALFGFKLPYTMVFHQCPTDGGHYPYAHFHVEFYPVHRGEQKIKYLAGVELGTNTFINPTNPEKKAQELKKVQV